MYKIIFTCIFIALTLTVNAQLVNGDDVIGMWLSEDKESRIEISKNGNEYVGRLVWTEGLFEADGKTSKRDVQNRDEKLRDRPLQNAPILQDFVYQDGIWDGGKMYDPKSGKTYSCVMKMRSKMLEIRSYIGIPLLGRSTYWQRQQRTVL